MVGDQFMNFQIWILFIAIVLFGLLAFKQVSALILAPVITIFVAVCSGLPILASLQNQFMPAAGDYVIKYFLIFFVGALFGAVYQFTGAAESIARAIVKVSKGKYAAPIIMCITGILTFGGVSGFVVFFVIYPIAIQLFREANLTRRLSVYPELYCHDESGYAGNGCIRAVSHHHSGHVCHDICLAGIQSQEIYRERADLQRSVSQIPAYGGGIKHRKR